MLDQYLEPITVANRPLGGKHRAYRMDGDSPLPDMRR